MINPAKLMKLKSHWTTFTQNHPRFPLFINAIAVSNKNGTPVLTEGTIIDINITTPEGKTMGTNVKLTASDLEMFRDLMDMK